MPPSKAEDFILFRKAGSAVCKPAAEIGGNT